ncbi:BON domain-containing protein [Streptomyces sp. NPDC056224]|uniref:BON domain-containing protein n=1 Tax=Streptomyces sp. NPDC056224 TaxID=3345750 RepID=UPI0035E0B967
MPAPRRKAATADFSRIRARNRAEVLREVVERLFLLSRQDIKIDVTHGVVTLTGHVRDAHLIPVATRLAQAVEGVVDVRCRLEST